MVIPIRNDELVHRTDLQCACCAIYDDPSKQVGKWRNAVDNSCTATTLSLLRPNSALF